MERGEVVRDGEQRGGIGRIGRYMNEGKKEGGREKE